MALLILLSFLIKIYILHIYNKYICNSYIIHIFKVQFYLKTLKGEVDLPCREDMLAALENKILQNQEKGVPVRHYHQLGNKMRPYLEDLANVAQLEHLPPVIYKIYDYTKYLRETRLESYREVLFKRLDDDNYYKTDDLP